MPYRIEAIRITSTIDVRPRFVPHACFDDPAQHDQILDPMPEPADGRAPRRANVPAGLRPYLAGLYKVPLLGREQEIHLFRKMNFLKYLANRLRDEVDPGRANSTRLDRIEQLEEEALAVRNQIIRANLRLVVSIAKRRIIVSRFALGGTGGKTLEQLGKELGITKERVRQLEARAREKLRQLAETETLDLLASDHSPQHAFFAPSQSGPGNSVYPMRGIETPNKNDGDRRRRAPPG